MNISEKPRSTQWATLSYRGESFAEVWFKPENAPFGLTFRLPQKSFAHPSISPLLTIENLLKAVGLAVTDVESWRYEDDTHSEIAGYHAELQQPLPPLPPDVTQLHLHVNMKSLIQEAVPTEPDEPKQTQAKWQELVTRWNTILGIEVTIDTLRQRMESLRSELESSSNKSLSADEKLNALNADVAQWNKAKSRARYVVPRLKEFIHRATWVMGTPERKKLEESFKKDAESLDNLAELDHELQILFKDRQILSAQGVTGYQEGRASCDDIQKCYSALQRNAASNAVKKRVATRAKGKSF